MTEHVRFYLFVFFRTENISEIKNHITTLNFSEGTLIFRGVICNGFTLDYLYLITVNLELSSCYSKNAIKDTTINSVKDTLARYLKT